MATHTQSMIVLKTNQHQNRFKIRCQVMIVFMISQTRKMASELLVLHPLYGQDIQNVCIIILYVTSYFLHILSIELIQKNND